MADGKTTGALAYLQLLRSEADAYERSLAAEDRGTDIELGGPLRLPPHPDSAQAPPEPGTAVARRMRDRWDNTWSEARQLAGLAADEGRTFTPAEQGRWDVLTEWLAGHAGVRRDDDLPEPPELIRTLRGWRSSVWHHALWLAGNAAQENRFLDEQHRGVSEQDIWAALSAELGHADARIGTALGVMARARETDAAYAALGDHVPAVCKRLRDRRANVWDEWCRVVTTAAQDDRALTDCELGATDALAWELECLDARLMGGLEWAYRWKIADEAFEMLSRH